MRILTSMGMVLTLAAAASIPAFGQNTQAPDSGQTQEQHGQWRHHEPNPEFETKMLTKRLNLSSDQAAQVEPILAAQHESLKALKPAAGTTPDFKVMHEQRKAIMEDTKQKLDAVLTPEQQQQLAKMHQHGAHGQHGDWAPKQSGGTSPSA